MQPDEAGPFEAALEASFNTSRHTADDRRAVIEALTITRLPRLRETDLPGAARAWLDAAAELRAEGHDVTPVILAGAVESSPRNAAAVAIARAILTAHRSAGAVDEFDQRPASSAR